MSTWSLNDGYGILKPDVITYGTNVKALSSQDDEECTLSSGTSISSSIISASTALALSQVKDRKKIQNTAFIKEALIKSSEKIQGLSITEQGSGVFNLDSFMSQVKSDSSPVLEIYPQIIDIRPLTNFKNTSSNPEEHLNKTQQSLKFMEQARSEPEKINSYFLPFSRQSIYSSMMPVSYNLTLMNSESMLSKITGYQVNLTKVNKTRSILSQLDEEYRLKELR